MMKQTTVLSSELIPAPRLRFDYAIRTQVSDTPFDGFRRWGPYDKNQPRKTAIRCALLYPKWANREARIIHEAFTRGMHFFKGFERFSHGISITEFNTIRLDTAEDASLSEQAKAYRDAITDMGDRPEWDIVFALIPYSPRYVHDAPYYVAKVELAARGIPCQLLTVEKVRSDDTLKWSLANIALQVYAKLGNTAWVVETPDKPNDLVIGIGQRLIRGHRIGQMERFLGFTTAYKNNGAFLSFQGIMGAASDDYYEQLSDAISSSLKAYREILLKQGAFVSDPERLVFHSFKKIGQEEINSIEGGIKLGSQEGGLIPYALIHIDSTGNFLIFDSDHRTYLPPRGYSVWLGPLQALLLSEGRERYEHRKMGFPSPLTIRIDHRSALNTDHLGDIFTDLLRQVYALSKVNWRGFNAAAIPVSLNYSRLIADLISSCQEPALWERIARAENLRDKAWFL